MLQAVKDAFPDYDPDVGRMSMGLNFSSKGAWNLTTFVWNGVDWQPWMIGYRLIWVTVAFGLAVAAAFVFDRFAKEGGEGAGRRGSGPKTSATPIGAASSVERPAFVDRARVAALAPLSTGASSSHFLRLLRAEVKLLLKGTSRWWWIVVLGLAVASWVAPLEGARRFVLPFAAIWPVLIWSGMGSREIRFGTDLVLFSTPHPLRLQVPAAWLGGVCVSLIVCGALLLRLTLAGEWGAVGAVVVGSCFAPALALALGTWTGSSRAFEGLYTALWYVGPLQPVPVVDFVGASRESVAIGTPVVFAAVTVVLLVVGFLGRKRQLRRS
jgi:hypothetical protein